MQVLSPYRGLIPTCCRRNRRSMFCWCHQLMNGMHVLSLLLMTIIIIYFNILQMRRKTYMQTWIELTYEICNNKTSCFNNKRFHDNCSPTIRTCALALPNGNHFNCVLFKCRKLQSTSKERDCHHCKRSFNCSVEWKQMYKEALEYSSW